MGFLLKAQKLFCHLLVESPFRLYTNVLTVLLLFGYLQMYGMKVCVGQRSSVTQSMLNVTERAPALTTGSSLTTPV